MAQEAAVPLETIRQVAREIAAEEVKKFARSGFLNNASITSGGLSIRGGGDLTISDGGRLRVNHPADVGGGNGLYVGDIYSEATSEYMGTGLLIEQPDGTDIVQARTDVESGGSRVELWDSGGRVAVATDSVSRQGLARPLVPGAFYPMRYTDWLASTSAAFEGLWKGELVKQQPRLSVALQVTTDASGTAGEARVMVDGVQLGAVQAVGFATSIRLVGPAAVAGDHMQKVIVEIQARRTAGTGAVRVAPLHVYGWQS